MIPRKISEHLLRIATKMPVLAITGPRQSGKSTLIKALFPDYSYFNLEDIEHRNFALDDPKSFLANCGDRCILDEIQHVPGLLSYIQVISDESKIAGQFIISGSQNLLLMESITQSLAGRVAIFNLLPLSLEELEQTSSSLSEYEDYILTGFYPRIYDLNLDPNQWLWDYLATYVERDVRQLVNVGDLSKFRQFIEICSGRIGQIVNLSEMGNIIGVSYKTINRWISVLEASFIVYRLPPYHNNFNKRIVKSPKLYFYDVGLACALLNIRTTEDLTRHFAKGALFENFILNEILKNQINRNLPSKNYFWNASGSHEVDLLMNRAGQLQAIEIKSSRTIHTRFFDTLKYFQNLSGALPENSYLIYGGDETQKRSQATVLSWKSLNEIPLT